MMPKRIQRKRTKGWRMPEGAVYVGRPTRWGNPFRLGLTYMWLGATQMPFPVPSMRDPGEYPNGLRAERLADPARAVDWFRAWVGWTENDIAVNVMAVLGGHDLACWCALDQPCHADVLLELTKGHSLKTIAEQLGNTERVVASTYAHVTPEMQRSAAASLNRRKA